MSDPRHSRGAQKRRPAHNPSGEVPAARSANQPSVDGLTWFAVALPGLETVLADELRMLTGSEVQVVRGGVELRGSLPSGYLLDLGSQLATRVLLRLGAVQARDLTQLRKRLAALPFESCLRPDVPVHVSVTTHRCRLFHSGAIAERVLLAASDRMRSKLVEQRAIAADTDETSPPDGADTCALEPFTRVLVRGEDDRFVVSVDSSGALLHKRGYRVEAGRAPLRETLAAGILRLAAYDGREPLVNAMCGAGTIALEAATLSLRRAPGLGRSFAIERFAGFEVDAARAVREALEARELATLPAPIVAFDRDRAAVARARRNAERANVDSLVGIEHADVATFEPPSPTGLLIANPPYGHRLGDRAGAREVWRSLADALRSRYRGYRVALLLPRGAPVHELRLRIHAQHALRNGGLPVTLLVGEV
jgi:putative N6-adenine-specific DNA methylase